MGVFVCRSHSPTHTGVSAPLPEKRPREHQRIDRRSAVSRHQNSAAWITEHELRGGFQRRKRLHNNYDMTGTHSEGAPETDLMGMRSLLRDGVKWVLVEGRVDGLGDVVGDDGGDDVHLHERQRGTSLVNSSEVPSEVRRSMTRRVDVARQNKITRAESERDS